MTWPDTTSFRLQGVKNRWNVFMHHEAGTESVPILHDGMSDEDERRLRVYHVKHIGLDHDLRLLDPGVYWAHWSPIPS